MDRPCVKYALLIYGTLIPLSKTWDLPLTGTAVQAAEFVFLILFILLLIRKKSFVRSVLASARSYLSLVLLLLITLLSLLFHSSLTGLIEGGGTVYLVIMSIVLAFLWKEYPRWRQKGIAAYVLGCIILALTAIAGAGMKYFWGPAGDLALTQDIPFIGTVHRLTGWTETPTMLGMTLTPALVYLLLQIRTGELRLWNGLATGCIALAWLGSLSKSHLVFAGVLIFYLAIRRTGLVRWIYLVTAATYLSGMLFFIHFYPVQKGNEPASPLVLKTPVAECKSGSLYPTKYVLSHFISWELGKQNIWTGVGPGGIRSAAGQLDLPHHQWKETLRENPLGSHNLWLGAFASMGIFGLISIMYLSYCILLSVVRKIPAQDVLVTTTVITLLFWMTEGLVTDVLHFRPGWFFLSLGMASLRNDRSSIV